jgi:hypothetical protein
LVILIKGINLMDEFVYRPENYIEPIALDAKPSEECERYHKNSCIQINIDKEYFKKQSLYNARN